MSLRNVENPVLQERRIKDIFNLERNKREKWMMNHGVKYLKYPYEYENFYNPGKSDAAPRPSLSVGSSISCCCKILHKPCRHTHTMNCRDYHYWMQNRPTVEMATNFRPADFTRDWKNAADPYNVVLEDIFSKRCDVCFPSNGIDYNYHVKKYY